MVRIMKGLSVVSTVGMVFILLGGALVTKTGSADGCGNSWPLCKGQLFPTDLTPELLIEYSHRLISTVVGATVLLLVMLIWTYLPHRKEARFLATISILFLIIQGLIGAAAVVWGQSDFILALHFGISLISFASIFILMIIIFEPHFSWNTDSLYIKRHHRLQFFLLSLYTLGVVYTGALVRHINAHFVCQSWPFCNNSQPFNFASYSFHQWIQMGHRFLAGVLCLWTVILFIQLFRNYPRSRLFHIGWGLATLLMLAQVSFGALIIFTRLNIWITLFHSLCITLYFGLLSYFLLLSYRSLQKKERTVLSPVSKMPLQQKLNPPNIYHK